MEADRTTERANPSPGSATRTQDRQPGIDLGCGPAKVPGAFGVDKYRFPGVDRVIDLDVLPWPLDSDAYATIHARHVIEHVADIVDFMNEVLRIARDGAAVNIVTPHFSSVHSWDDPTHRRHLSCKWHTVFTERYLKGADSRFEHVSTAIEFPTRSLRSLVPRLIIRLMGRDWWEKHYAFVFRGRNITTVLRVRKPSPT